MPPRNSNQRRRRVRSSISANPNRVTEVEAEADVLDAQWDTRRAGARAGRGFSFQNATGAWLAAQILSSSIPFSSLVPEGLEDMSLEGEASLHIQVKSRIGRRSKFTAAEAASHVVNVWLAHLERGSLTDGVTLILERGVAGEDYESLDVLRPIGEMLAGDSAFRSAIVRVGNSRGLLREQIDQLLAHLSVVTGAWDSVTADAWRHLETVAPEVPLLAISLFERELRVLVATASDENAERSQLDRSSLDRTRLVASFSEYLATVDRAALELAISAGICEPFSNHAPLRDGDKYYEGVATQPGHVRAGLVVPRPDLIAAAISALQDEGAAVLHGPSGVGKSAVLWTVPDAMPGVLWFRVLRLRDADVEPLVRLARAWAVSYENPVGLLVDSAGVAGFEGWNALRHQARAIPGLCLIATARNEDLAQLGDLTQVATLRVDLDEVGADAIHAGLLRTGATTSPHWQESYEQSRGLTMEFTHLLARGRRLREVIGDQISARLAENRDLELQILAIVSLADRSSASVALSSVASLLANSEMDVRRAIGRLQAEHLLSEKDGALSGVHPLRSAAIVECIHATPPPTLSGSVANALKCLEDVQVSRFVVNLLKEEPDELATVISTAVAEQLTAVRLASYMHGLRLWAFYERARDWKGIVETHGVDASNWPLTFNIATAEIELPDIFPANIRQAAAEMAALPLARPGRRLVQEVGVERVSSIMASIADPETGSTLLFELEGLSGESVDTLTERISAADAFGMTVRSARLEDLSGMIDAAHRVSLPLARALVDHAGGISHLLSRLLAEEPWTLEAELQAHEDQLVGFARLLTGPTELGEPRERAIAFGRLLLRLFPDIERVDVKVLLPGRRELEIDGPEIGSTGLLRQYDHADLAVAWNRERMYAVSTLIGATDTERLSRALPLLERLVDPVQLLLRHFATGGARPIDGPRLANTVAEIGRASRAIPPALGVASIGGDGRDTEFLDHLTGFLTDFTDNVLGRLAQGENLGLLAAHISDHVLGKSLPGVVKQPWNLIGLQGTPHAVGVLGQLMRDLHAILIELVRDGDSGPAILRSGRSGRYEWAVDRAAETARRLTKASQDSRTTMVADSLASLALSIELTPPRPDVSRPGEWLLIVHLDSMLEWAEALQSIQTVLEPLRLPLESFLVVPVRASRRIAGMSMVLKARLWPFPDEAQWATALPAEMETPLADLLAEGFESLQTLSSLMELPEPQHAHPAVVASSEQAQVHLATTLESLANFPHDELIREIQGMLNRLTSLVLAESTGSGDGDSIAARLSQGVLTGEASEELQQAAGARLLAIEWDIDPGNAQALLDQVVE